MNFSPVKLFLGFVSFLSANRNELKIRMDGKLLFQCNYLEPNYQSNTRILLTQEETFSETISRGFLELKSDRLYSGHHLQSALDTILNFSKFGDADHAEDFFVMVRNAGNHNFLVVTFGLSQNLD